MPSDIKRKAGRAVGRVQGVGFRYFVMNSAKAVGVTGWVKNMRDGSVTMELQGDAETIEQLTAKIKAGDNWIRVNSLELTDLPVVEGEKDFAVRY